MCIHYSHPAQFYYEQRMKERAKRIKLKSIEAQQYIVNKLKLGWTPEIIAGRIKLNEALLNLSHQTPYVTTDILTLRNAAIKGIGIVQLPLLMVTNQIKDGTLLQLFPEWQAKKDIIHVVYPSRRGLLPAVRALIDYLDEYFHSFEEA